MYSIGEGRNKPPSRWAGHTRRREGGRVDDMKGSVGTGSGRDKKRMKEAVVTSRNKR